MDLTIASNNSKIIYEPVDYETLASNYDPKSKENIVLTVSRLEPGKNLWSVIEIASHNPNANFIIAGTTKTPRASMVLDSLERLIDKLKTKNVTIMKDLSRKKLVELYVKAKIYLHPLYIEHFGIAIAEGASSGAVPVVYRDGGGWFDIAAKVNQDLGYTNLIEAKSIVKKIIEDHDFWLKLSRKSVDIAKDFSWNSFKERWNSAVDEIYRIKKDN
jgi:glycosyltransferase involved in cell wall biosynthesis